MSWNIDVLNLGRCYVPSYYYKLAKSKDLNKNGNQWSSIDVDPFPSYEIEFKKQELNKLQLHDSVDIAKFFKATYHTDDNNHLYFIAIPGDDFVFQLKGKNEVVLKKGYAYLFNQSRLHRAHNNGKAFVCAIAGVYRHELKNIKKILKIGK